jgi:hypothetical protein
MSNPGEEHWKAMGRFAGYVKSGASYGLEFRKPKEFRVVMTTDADFAKNPDTRKSVSGIHVTICNAVTLVNSSTNQKTVALSTTNAEYVSASKGCQELVFVHQLSDETMGPKFMERPAYVYGDTMGAVFLIKIDKISENTKHMEIRHYFMRSLQEEGEMSVRFKPTDELVADVNTKNNPVVVLTKHRRTMRRAERKSKKHKLGSRK